MGRDLSKDLEALNLASVAVAELSVRYRLAMPADQLELGEARRSAWTAYEQVRGRLLQHGAIISDEQLDSIRDVRETLSVSTETSGIARAAQQLAHVLGGISAR